MINNEDQLHAQRLNQTRMISYQKEQKYKTITTKKAKSKSNTAKNLLILLTAVFFDIFALIPFVSVIFNTIFAGILIAVYGNSGKKKGGTSKVLATSFIGSIFDFFFSILPVNTVTALIRINA